MREILFRAKTVDGDWTYMSVSNDESWSTVVDIKTIGQFTGLKDKNGKKIFEGDVVRLNKLKPKDLIKVTIPFEGGSRDVVGKVGKDYMVPRGISPVTHTLSEKGLLFFEPGWVGTRFPFTLTTTEGEKLQIDINSDLRVELLERKREKKGKKK